MIEGGCECCGRYTQCDFDSTSIKSEPKLICSECNEMYYSTTAIRNNKLNKILKKSFMSKIKDLFYFI